MQGGMGGSIHAAVLRDMGAGEPLKLSLSLTNDIYLQGDRRFHHTVPHRWEFPMGAMQILFENPAWQRSNEHGTRIIKSGMSPEASRLQLHLQRSWPKVHQRQARKRSSRIRKASQKPGIEYKITTGIMAEAHGATGH
jgi:hypothetical protein